MFVGLSLVVLGLGALVALRKPRERDHQAAKASQTLEPQAAFRERSEKSSTPMAPVPAELADLALRLRKSFRPGASSFSRARLMLEFDRLLKEEPPLAFIFEEVVDSGSPSGYRKYLSDSLIKVTKNSPGRYREEVVGLLRQSLNNSAVDPAVKIHLARSLIVLDDGPETVSQIASLSSGASQDSRRASFLVALTQSKNSRPVVETMVAEMSENPGDWPESWAVVLPPLILAPGELPVDLLEKVIEGTESPELLQQAALALSRRPATSTRESLRQLIASRQIHTHSPN